jgi:hypothetical protein
MSARVDEIAGLQAMKVALVKFAELAEQCIVDAESEVKRTSQWLELEQGPYWVAQIRKRSELVSRCKEAVRQKQLFKDSTGGRSSAVDELKALAKAQAMLAEAEEKLAATKSHARKMQKVSMDFRGGVQKLATVLQTDVVNGVARLNTMSNLLGQYAADAPIEEKSVANVASTDTKPVEPQPENTDGTL